jgi:hypothetical protein
MIVELELPASWKGLRLPRALDRRLQELLDRQDTEGKLSPRERREAEALVELAEVLSELELRSQPRKGRRAP